MERAGDHMQELVTAFLKLTPWRACRVAPWRLRDWLAWVAEREPRLRLAAAGGVAWGAFVVGLGLTALR